MTEQSKRVDVIARVRELDEAIERRGAASEAGERVRARLQARALERRFAARLRWWPALAFAAGALVMAAALLLGRAPTQTPELAEGDTSPASPRDPQPEPQLDAARACASAMSGVADLPANACVSADGVRLTALIGSRFSFEPDRVELLAGELLVDVAPRPEHPLEVVVGVANIEVVGTSFVIHRDPASGWISMLEGHVRVRVGDGALTDLRDGQQLDWPTAALTEVEPAEHDQPRPAPAPVRRDDEGLAELLDEVATLRRQGDYRAAVERLRAGDRKTWSARGRQLVSYEIGTLLERQLHDDDAACGHWARHLEQFPNGRYEAIIARSIARLDCER